MPKIRKSVYIGIGGTGIKAIANAKKMYEEIFGEDRIPAEIAFVAIDFDRAIATDTNLPTRIDRDFINIPNALNPLQIYTTMSKQGMYKWIFDKNANYIPNNIQNGASQVRTTGRLLTELIMPNIQTKIDTAIQQVTTMRPKSNEYDVDSDPRVDIHIAMSLAGGTGCGSFINIAQYIKEQYKSNVVLYGYGVLYSVFRTMDPGALATPRVRLNSYSAVLDLDYFQSASVTNPVSFVVQGQKKTINSPLYNYFYLVDNTTEAGNIVPHVNLLCQALGTCMYLSGGELGDSVRTMFSNAEWTLSNYNWDNKLGWAHRIGVCQVVYNGEQLADIYALKAKLALIRQLKAAGSDVEQEATNWTEVAGVREDGNEFNMLIDSIFSPDAFGRLRDVVLSSDDSYEATYSAIRQYIENYQTFPSKDALQPLRERILNSLNEKVVSILNGAGGVADVMTFLNSLSRICSGYKREMEDERQAFISSVQTKEAALEVECNAYNSYSKKPWPLCTKSGKAEHLEALASAAKGIIKAKIEARRREEAAEVFMVLLNEINNLLSEVKSTNAILDSLIDVYSDELVAQQNLKQNNHLFEYDLSAKDRLSLALGQNDVSLSDFALSLPKPMLELTKEELVSAFDAYAAALPGCKKYKDVLIEDVINNLSPADYERLKSEIAIKSSPLLALRDGGLLDPATGKTPSQKMNLQYMVSLFKADKDKASRLESDPNLQLGDFKPQFIPSDTPTMRQRMIFYRSDAAIIPYCVQCLDESVRNEYEMTLASVNAGNAMFHPHFDLQIFGEMKKSDFKLKPEMTDEAMFYWVAGQLFGWTVINEKARNMEKGPNGETIKEIDKQDVQHEKYLRYERNKYWYWNEKGTGKGMAGKWTEINTADRKRAFDFFKTDVLNTLREDYKALILSKLGEFGIGKYKFMIEELIANGKMDYIDKHMCASKSSSTIYSGNTLEAGFVDEEWAYIESKFWNALQLLK